MQWCNKKRLLYALVISQKEKQRKGTEAEYT